MQKHEELGLPILNMDLFTSVWLNEEKPQPQTLNGFYYFTYEMVWFENIAHSIHM